jgi:F-box/leucine-rich repeat protein 7
MPTNYLYLQFVDLSYCPYVNDRCVQNLCKSCPFIKNFYLRKCKLITDISLLHIAKYCLNLRELSLCQCVKLTDNGIRYLGINTSSYKNNDENDYVNSKFKNSIKSIAKSRIKYLSLAKCPQITDNSLIYLSKIGFFSQIKYLNLRGCCQISDKFVKYFTGGGSRSPPKLKFDQENIEKDDSSFSSDIHNYRNHIPFQLKSLDLSKCQITDKALQYICRTLSHKTNSLQRLNLRYCEGITDDGIKLLALHCKHLQHLNVTKCNKITAHALKQIKINCQSCIIQHTHFSFC